MEKEPNLADIGLVNETGVGQVALLLCLFLGEDVPFVGVLSLDLARASEGEPLFSARVGFHFRHFDLLLWSAVLPWGFVCRDLAHLAPA